MWNDFVSNLNSDALNTYLHLYKLAPAHHLHFTKYCLRWPINYVIVKYILHSLEVPTTDGTESIYIYIYEHSSILVLCLVIWVRSMKLGIFSGRTNRPSVNVIKVMLDLCWRMCVFWLFRNPSKGKKKTVDVADAILGRGARRETTAMITGGGGQYTSCLL